ncbi:glycosyltransferase [Dysgonomonas sp. 520]|uniref:glycosyltransferase n=1 Tax=Dysgonomonas sp. 520 TaxID=2302931 RepID=UPI0013D7CA95|nr:glycosyltransferase [Dysgonomonas sp. 520]
MITEGNTNSRKYDNPGSNETDSVLISVIIPVYNIEKLLNRCLDSVVGQTYTNLEIILIDDGSADSSPQICDQYAEHDLRIKVVHKENGGVSAARNLGLDIASGDYISFVDSDDWLEPDMYDTLVTYLKNDPTDILRFNACKKGEVFTSTHLSGNFEGNRMTDEVVLSMIGSEKLGEIFLMGVPWIYLYRREVIERNNIRFDVNLRRSEDRLFCITTMLYARKITFVKDVLYHYEVLTTSLSNKYDPLRWQQELYYLDMLRKEYTKVFSPQYVEKADKRIKSDYVLRVVISLDNLFFSVNDNTFRHNYKQVRNIINNEKVRKSVQDLKQVKTGIRKRFLFFCVKHRLSFALTLFQTMMKLRNKV